ncbi:MAG: helix-turn-helix domain-containing protein [Terriglobales bacterium]
MPNDFACAFGDAFQKFLEDHEITQSDAADRLGLKRGGKARINTYCHDSPKGTRPKPSAEILYLACTKLGFSFEYQGYKIGAAELNGNARPGKDRTEQLSLPLERQFDLTEHNGIVSVTVRRPPGRVVVSLSLKAAL